MPDIDTFCSDALDFISEGYWNHFLKYMAEKGYTEEQVDQLTEQVNKRAGRCC